MNSYIYTGAPSNDSICLFGIRKGDSKDIKADKIFYYHKIIMEQYLKALTKLLQESENKVKLDPLDDSIALPLLFLACHIFELCFKTLLFGFYELNRKPETNVFLTEEQKKSIDFHLIRGHDLHKLFSLIKEILSHHENKKQFNMPDSIEQIVSEFREYEISSIDSRYFFNKNGQFNLHTNPRLSIRILKIGEILDNLHHKVLSYCYEIKY